jgi:hypothetical protein
VAPGVLFVAVPGVEELFANAVGGAAVASEEGSSDWMVDGVNI